MDFNENFKTIWRGVSPPPLALVCLYTLPYAIYIFASET